MYFVEIPLPKKNMGDSTWHLERKKIFNRKLNSERIEQISPDGYKGCSEEINAFFQGFDSICIGLVCKKLNFVV